MTYWKKRQLKTPTLESRLTNKGNWYMDNDIKSWLYDTLDAINEIDSFFIDVPKDFLSFQNDLRTKRAVERNIEIIGEATSNV